MFVLNLVCRDPSLKQQTLATLRSVFHSVLSVPLDGEVNEVVFCSIDREAQDMHSWLRQSATKANAMAKKAKTREELVDVNELLKNVHIATN
jgi:hypothetical protein